MKNTRNIKYHVIIIGLLTVFAAFSFFPREAAWFSSEDETEEPAELLYPESDEIPVVEPRIGT